MQLLKQNSVTILLSGQEPVVDRLSPSLKAYPNKQMNLTLALILYEQTVRDASYGSVFL